MRRWGTLLALLALLLASPASAFTAGLPSTPPSEVSAPAALTPGSDAVVRADGDCLRVREAPALKARQLTCLPEGAVVQVLEGVQTADGYTWRKVQSGTIVGWAAEQYLQPADTTAGACPAAPPAAQPTPQPAAQPVSNSTTGFAGGDLPAQGGFGLTVWRGGSAADIATTAAAGGCRLGAVWATNPDGAFVFYIFGAPEIVNQAWLARFPGGDVPAGTAILLACATATASALSGTTAQGGSGGPDLASTIEPSTLTAAAPAVAAKAVLVLDGGSGKTLFEKEARVPLPPASLTKMVTAILTI